MKRVMDKKLASIIVLLTTICQFLLTPVALAERPIYPFKDMVDSGKTRHHIIPWEELVESCNQNLKDENGKVDERKTNYFLSNYKEFRNANLAYPNQQDLVQKYVEHDQAAQDDMDSLCAWMPGNLVIGPSNRPNDPGDKYDRTANECRKIASTKKQEYERYCSLYMDWSYKAPKKKWSKIVQVMLIKYQMIEPKQEKRDCWNTRFNAKISLR